MLPKDMTERQLRTHAMMLEYQTYSISELAERWGRTEDSIRKTAFRYHVTKADDYQCKVRRKPVVRTSKRAAKVLEKRQKELEDELQVKQVTEMYPLHSREYIMKELGISVGRLNHILKKYGIRKYKLNKTKEITQ